jgi:hypothetical protein
MVSWAWEAAVVSTLPRRIGLAASAAALVIFAVALQTGGPHPVEVAVDVVDVPPSAELASLVEELRAGRTTLSGGARVLSTHRLHPTAGQPDAAHVGPRRIEVALLERAVEEVELGLRVLDDDGRVRVDTEVRLAPGEPFVVVHPKGATAFSLTPRW